MKKPTVYVIGGPNGSGKTTLFTALFGNKPSIRFVNADIIAAQLNPKEPERAAIAAGKEMIKLLKKLRGDLKDFAFETTLAGMGYAKYLQDLKDDGFKIVILFVWLRTEETAVQRVKERKSKGGHNVPETDIRRRYIKAAYNMNSLYRHLADEWFLYDNTEYIPQLVAAKESGRLKIENKKLFDEIMKEVKTYEQKVIKNQ